jgi:death-on-curing protein
MFAGAACARKCAITLEIPFARTRNSESSLPSKPVQFLTLDEVLEIHGVLAERFGGPTGVRDMGLLESALYRPQSGYYKDLTEMATAMFESLLMNHPFVDGNKRIAFFATDVFLRLNGYKLQVEATAAHAFLLGLLDSNACDLDHLLPWIETSIVKL